ncbi:uncharacterized protein LOC141852309 [Brevipalpus obovatus]|uniref:uncharacterized protein LOC141852309 n=1 Tax=Brevipalpus obovatus TaxID=246614 RepID=UPI003D9DCF51
MDNHHHSGSSINKMMKEESFATRMMINTVENGNILHENATSLMRHQSENQSNEAGSSIFLILGLIAIGAIFLAFYGVYRYRRTQKRKRLSRIPFSGLDDCPSNMGKKSFFKISKRKFRKNGWFFIRFDLKRPRFSRQGRKNMGERQSLAASSTLPPPAIRTLAPSAEDRKPRITGMESSV